MPGGRVALLTTAAYAHLDEDLPPLVASLQALGVTAATVDWHDDGAAWSDFELVVIRSPWDYTEHLEEFLAVLEHISAVTRLANPLPVVRANADKRYLVRLAEAGVPVVPTAVLEPGDEVVLPPETPVVVKPTVSAGARDTERYAPEAHDAARSHAARLLGAGRSVLVQPYVDGVDELGETGLVHLGGELSHAFRKGPILVPDGRFVEGLYREEQISPRTPSRPEVAVAEQVLDALPTIAPGWTRADLLYARVDLVPGPAGPLLMELELIEPSWFLATSHDAPHRAAVAVHRALEAHTAARG